MSPSRLRRLVLFSPLVVLTLFFAALGWRNWNLSMDDEEVMAAVVDDFRGASQKPTDVINPVTMRASAPFADEQVTVVSRKSGQPVPAALMARLKSDYPKARLFNAVKVNGSPECSFSFEVVEIINRFNAKCVVYYILTAPHSASRAEFKETLVLKRSPIDFQSSDWHVEPTPTPLPFPTPSLGIPNIIAR